MKQKATWIDWAKFISVMAIFVAGMIVMLVYKVENIWIWGIYIVLWTWLEMRIAKNIRLKWWVWVLILAGLSLLDLLVINLIH